MNKKKIILFIAEGINDETCLALILSKILETSEIKFQLTKGDITTNLLTNPTNIAAKIGDLVNGFRGKIFTPSDFLEVVHLVDTDGAFVSNDKIVLDKSYIDTYYSDNEILTDNVEKIIDRNKRKVENLGRLISLNKTCRTIPYSVYFFSCNMDHVLHGDANLTMEEKSSFARRFEKQYVDDLDGFMKLLNEKACPNETFALSWDFIKLETNSLQAYSNFSLFFSNPKNGR